jgi:Flp pilus assembly protein TadD
MNAIRFAIVVSMALILIGCGTASNPTQIRPTNIADPSAEIEEPTTAKDYSNRGVAAYERGDYDAAIEDLTKAIELDGEDPDNYVNRGTAYARTGELDQALADYTAAIELDD